MSEIFKEAFCRNEEENPALVQIYVENTAYQHAFCFALGLEENRSGNKSLLYAIIGGADSTIQAMKVAIDSGMEVMKFGYGEKTLTGYDFREEFRFFSEKGAYTSFPMKVGNKKCLAIVHDDILMNGKYLISYDGDPAKELQNLMGGRPYGLCIPDEWKDVVFEECTKRGYIRPVSLYYDQGLFTNGLELFELAMTEVQADNLITELLQTKKIKFKYEGSGKKIEEIKDLTTYMMDQVDNMMAKLSEQITPLHDPMKDSGLAHYDSYNMELFPVQNQVSTAISRALLKQKAVILQGEMSTGKSKMMTAIADGWAHLKGKKGYRAILMVPPSLTKKWSEEEIYDLLPEPRAKVIHIENSAQLIEYHKKWMEQGRPKPDKPTFFVLSFTTTRDDASIAPAVSFKRKKTRKQLENELQPYRFGYYCPDCGKPHHVIESTHVVVNEDGEEEQQYNKRPMVDGEFGDSRRHHNGNKPANAFCSECGASLWTKKVPTRYKSFKEWTDFEKKLVHAIKQENPNYVKQLLINQPEIKKKVGRPRRVAAIEYIRRKMKNFFDVAIVDEVHERARRCLISSTAAK